MAPYLTRYLSLILGNEAAGEGLLVRCVMPSALPLLITVARNLAPQLFILSLYVDNSIGIVIY